jgi:anti-sigma-K factor RskA
MDPQQIEELLEFYALGALDDEERKLVEAYLEQHPEARRKVRELEGVTAALPYSVPPVEPSARSKDQLMQRIAADRPPLPGIRVQAASRPRLRLENMWRALSLGAAVLAILWALVLSRQVASLRSEIATLRQALVAQSQSIQKINASLPQPGKSELVTLPVQGTDRQPGAQGQLIADRNSRSAVLVMSNLAPLKAGRTYQVWLIQGDQPHNAGLLNVDEHGQGVLVLTSDRAIGSFNALGISVEPEGGSPQPTGEIVVLSKF